MGPGRLKTAVLGLDNGGRLLLEAASQVEYLDIYAVADSDAALAEKLAGQYDCAAYDDYRQLIMQNEFDCLLVAAPLHSCEKYVKVAIKKKFNVLKTPPPARDFEQAVELVRLAEDNKIAFVVANPLRFARSFTALRRLLQQGRIEQTFFIAASCHFTGGPRPAWQTDPRLAGGGVLLHDCYAMFDQITLNFGTPEQVYCLNTNRAQDKKQRLYLTEDTAVVTMKFADTLFGSLIASSRVQTVPDEMSLRVYAENEVTTVTGTQLFGGSGDETAEPQSFDYDPLRSTIELLSNFALGIMSPEENKLVSGIRENLRNMAVIESSYLSARTGFPEEPSRILDMPSP